MDPTQPPPCLTCLIHGRGASCYWSSGFPSCIPCSASGQVCAPSHSLFTDFSAVCSASVPAATVPAAASAIPTCSPQIIAAPPAFSNLSPSTQASFAAAGGPQLPTTAGSFEPHPYAPSEQIEASASPPTKKKRRTSVASHAHSTSSGTGSARTRELRTPSKGKRRPQSLQQSPPEAAPATIVPVMEGGLVDAAAVRALAGDLFEESFRIRPEIWGFGMFLCPDIRGKFERVDGDMTRMGPIGQALVMIRVAWGATSTMHPGVVPSAQGHTGAMRLYGDLSDFGRERNHAHRALAAQAVKLVEDAGVYQSESYRSVGLLAELAILFGRTDWEVAKSYTRAAINQWRKVQSWKPSSNLSPAEGHICFALACVDGMTCFYGGTKGPADMPELSDDDLTKLVVPSRIPAPGWIRPDFFPEQDLPSWTALPITCINDVLQASNTSCYRMLAVLAGTSADFRSRIPPSTYQKVVETVLKQQPTLRRLRIKWGDGVDGEDSVLSTFELEEHGAHREYIYRLLSILHLRLAESSLLLPLYEEVCTLVWRDLSKLAAAAAEIRNSPPKASSWWGSRLQVFYRWLELLPGGHAFLATFVRDGEGTLESRRFEADCILQLLKTVAFFGDQYIAGAKEAERALRDFDRNAVKAFPGGQAPA